MTDPTASTATDAPPTPACRRRRKTLAENEAAIARFEAQAKKIRRAEIDRVLKIAERVGWFDVAVDPADLERALRDLVERARRDQVIETASD